MTDLFVVLVASITVTSYRPIPEQTDNTPTITSIGHRVHPYGAAVTQDLLRSGEICYGDVVAVGGYGLRIINDTFHPRIKRGIDLLVETHAQEKKVGVRRDQTVQVIRSPQRACTQREAMTMAMVNSKKIARMLAQFKTDHGREPTSDEFRSLINTRPRAPANDARQAGHDGGARKGSSYRGDSVAQ